MPSPHSTQKLLTIRANEEAKGRSRHAHAPAIFRETALDTHKTAPPEYFGPSIIPEKKEYSTRVTSASLRSTTRQQRAALDALDRTSRLAGQGEVRSVFQPTAEQMPVCAAAGERRTNVANSEWALLDTLEVSLFLGEKEARQRATRRAQEAQRGALEEQLAALAAAKAAEAAAKQVERQQTEAAAAAYVVAQRQRQEELRSSLVRLKDERQQTLAEARAATEAALVAKRAEEERQVAITAEKIAAERAAAEARVAAVKAEAARTAAENEAIKAARRAAEAEARAADAATTKRMMDMMEAKERARDGVAEAFHRGVMRRAELAGTRNLDDARARKEREDRLIAEAAAEAARRDAARAAAEADKRARQKAEIVAVNEELKRAKAERAAAERASELSLRPRLDALTATQAAEVARRELASRERVTTTKRFVAGQMQDSLAKAKVDDVFMSEQERLINRRLLEQAHATVVSPHQYSVRLY